MTENTAGCIIPHDSSEHIENTATNKLTTHTSNGPGVDCNCPVCIFAKSQAPGQAYDLTECPRCRSLLKKE
jgi:ssDNA-binding Zn-finger/Zn-ribbon topoisomerase 1